ncbi:L-lactate MFS transporter [Clostridium aceticum]|nr:OFA family MFS transporter [Clostridium aceticum]KJF27147.1 MFS transporter [Clostridium aceticum]
MENLVKQSNHPSKQRWLYVFLGIIVMMCLGTVYSWSVFRIPIEEFFNIGSTQSGLPYAVSLVFYAFFMFITGKYLDRYSPRLVIFIGGLLVGLGWLLSGYAENIYVLTITYGVIIGAGVGIIYGAPMTVVAKWFPEKKGLIVGFVLAGFGLSPFVTAPAASYLIENYGLMPSFKMLGISFGVIISLLSYPFKYPLASEDQPVKATSTAVVDVNNINTAEMMKAESFRSLYFNFIIGTMIGLMLIGMTGNVGIELVGLSPNTMALLMALFAVFNGIGRPIFGWLTDKLSHKKAMLLSYVLIMIAASLMLMANKGSLVLYTIAFSIFWFNLGGWLAIAPASTLSLYGTKHYSQNYGVVFTAYGIGAITGVFGSGLLKDVLQSYHSIFYFVILLCVVGILSSQKFALSHYRSQAVDK